VCGRPLVIGDHVLVEEHGAGNVAGRIFGLGVRASAPARYQEASTIEFRRPSFFSSQSAETTKRLFSSAHD
jgi:hypothetical protein